MSNSILRGTFVALGVCLAAGSAHAETMMFRAALTGTEQVPPVETPAKGTADVTFDTASKMMSWTVDYSGLSGDPKAAHFHGPAAMGENAKPVVPIELTDLKKGSATLTDAQVTELEGGKMYLNIHTAAHPDGEIRGQVVTAK